MQPDERPADDETQHRAAASPGTEATTGKVAPSVQPRVVDDRPLVPDRSADDSDTGWGDGYDSNDERLLRDVPPHW